MKKNLHIKKLLGFLILLLGSGLAFTAYGTHAIATTPPSGAIDPISKITSTNPGEVESFLGLNRVEAFNHQRKLIESDISESDLNFVGLHLSKAIDLTIKNHLETKEAREKIEESLGRRWQSLSPLLPHVDTSTSQSRTYKENLAALGFKQGGTVGPFNTFDMRFQLVQKLLDLSALSDAKVGNINVAIARYGQELSNQKVILIAAMAYLDALRSQGIFKAAKANLDLSERLLKQANRQMEAGIATNVDVARAQTRVARDKLRLAQANQSLHDTYLELQRVTGLSYDSTVQLLNSLCFIKESIPSLDVALKTAIDERIEMRIATETIRASKYHLYSARAQSLPQFEFLGDYGWSGNEPDHGGGTRPTGSVMFRAKMPLFEGGLIHGEIKEAASQKRQEEIRYDDLQRQVEEDVHMALWTIDTSLEQVNAAGQVVQVSERELELACNRFAQGIGDNVEVVNAQTGLALARDEYVAALTQYHGARMNWYFALGEAEKFFLKDSAK